MKFETKNFLCKLCGLEFAWEAGEQAFAQKLVDKGTFERLIPPKLCPECREKRKVRKGF